MAMTFFHLINDQNLYSNTQFVKEVEVDESLFQFFHRNIMLSEEEIVHLCCQTINQSDNKEWLSERCKRISASKSAHSIKNLKRKSVDSLVTDILLPKKFSTSSTQYGICHENSARKLYEKMRPECNVVQVGLIVKVDQPWLCSSPDGIVTKDCCVDRLIEIKCPYSSAKKSVFDSENQQCNVPYLYVENTEIKLKESHPYFTQCQILLYVCGLTVCDLFVYSPVEAI